MELPESKRAAALADRVNIKLILASLLRRKLPFTDSVLRQVATVLAQLSSWGSCPQAYFGTTVSRYQKSGKELSPRLIDACAKLIKQWGNGNPEQKKWAAKLRDPLGDDFKELPKNPINKNGEVFAEALLDDLEEMNDTSHIQWVTLIDHASDSQPGSPTKKWLRTAEKHIDAIGQQSVCNNLIKWFPLIDKPSTAEDSDEETYYLDSSLLFCEPHLAVLKGLAWTAALVANDELTRVIGEAGISSYKKVPGIGARATRVGNACVWALGHIGSDCALAHLALMKTKVKFGTAQKSIQKALVKLAAQINVTTDELEEMSVPEYGLTEVGGYQEQLGEYTAVVTVIDKKPTLSFINPKGKAIKSVPAAVRADYGEELKELRASLKDLEKMISAQRERLDNIFLLEKSWSYSIWSERYLNHPVVGILARRLIWTLTLDGKMTEAIWLEGGLKDINGVEVDIDINNTTVQIWHPINSEADVVMEWRRFLFEYMIQQPFKQAHREVYLLTDAEKNTEIYSNRFASHILKQHQFSSLCAIRGWKNKLRMMVDDCYPPAYKELPNYGLRAEFWIEGIGDDWHEDYVVDSGAYRYLSTDQVRFYKIDSPLLYAHACGGSYGQGWGNETSEAPLDIEDIPPLVLSEILRDVDLFVGVTSVGNDPNWSDGGPNGSFQNYWNEQSFGNLGETAEMRKEILQHLLPKLKIADRCELEGKFLKVKGSIRSYKIHLGSGNILMTPNDQYLCIVKAPSRVSSKNIVFLPFSGDDKLSVILSKAFMLADDDKIKDSTILSQINRDFV
ncbi:DUF4132 domain-containing protein [Persicirhabdus sediminis]|nr:DUF4132 domain-containing protein [Persicirhabdus sediminis]